MNGTLSGLVFISHRASGSDVHDARRELERFLSLPHIRDAPRGISGLLMHNSDGFAGIIEGERFAVQGAFERLREDRRHARVLLLTFEPIEARTFDGWSMTRIGDETELLAQLVVERRTQFAEAAAAECVELPCGSLHREQLLEIVERLAYGIAAGRARRAA